MTNDNPNWKRIEPDQIETVVQTKLDKPKRDRTKRTNGGHKQRRDGSLARRDAENLPGAMTPGHTLPQTSIWSPTDLIKACRDTETVKKMLGTLKKCADDEQAPWPARVCAASIWLDRAYGKAPQMIAVADVTNQQRLDMTRYSDEELMLLERLLRKGQQEPATVDLSVSEQSTGTED